MKPIFVVLYLLTAGSVAFGIIHSSIKYQSTINLSDLFHTKKFSTLQDKINILAYLGYCVSFLILTFTLLITLYRYSKYLRRMFTAKSPVESIDPPIIRCLNQIITNTMEQSVIFSCLFTYWIHFIAEGRKVQDGLLFIFLFLVGRVVFSTLYLIGAIVKFTPLRSAGFFLTMLIHSTLLLECLTNKPVLT